jgi:microsomal dipeptidase-like Zn-dependent dipeptidase
MRRRLVLGSGLLIVAAAGYVFFFLARHVEASINIVVRQPPYDGSNRARELHRQLFVADLHADTLLWDRDLLSRSSHGHVDVPRLIEGNVALQVFTIVTKAPRDIQLSNNDSATDSITLLALAERWPVATWTSHMSRAEYQARRLHDAAARSDGRLTIITTARDLTRYIERRSAEPAITAGLLGIEGAHALDGDLDNLDRLFDEGVRLVSLTHLADNEMGGSAQGIGRGGLTAEGKALIRRLESKQMLVDLAHSSPTAFDDAIATATRPVVVSHTGVTATCDNSRNLTDDQLRAVARTGGLVGIGYWETATCGTDAASIARAIRHAVDVAGISHVGLGSDFDGAVAQPFDTTGLVEVTDALLVNGFNDVEIQALMGGNIVRLLLTMLPAVPSQ